MNDVKKIIIALKDEYSYSYRKPQAKLVEEKSRSVETVEKEPPFAIIRSG